MAKSNGIKSLKQAARLLNKHAPDGESLAYINPDEARLLRSHGGSGIQTLSTVPSYASIFGWDVPFTGDKEWGEVIGDVFGYGKQTVLDKSGKAVEVAGRSPFQDAIAVYAFLRAKKDAEGLNDAEMSEFNRLNQQLTAGREEFKEYTGGGEHLTAPTNVPTTISDVAQFTETTGRPDMITTPTAAQGGRIGYNLGGIDRPFQGIGALNPRMGYAQGMGPHWDVPTFSEGVQQMYDSGPAGVDTETINWERESPYGAIADLLKGTRVQESETTDYNTVPYPVIREKMKSYADMVGSDNIYDIIKIATQVGDKEFVDYLRMNFTFEGDRGVENPGFSTASGALGAAQGGRIGYAGGGIWGMDTARREWDILSPEGKAPYKDFVDFFLNGPWGSNVERRPKIAQGGRIGAQSGGIMPLLNMGGMEKDYRQDGGFVPIGRKEKADDVPARLSKNEFVFTADAVRAAGGGDIDQGAQRMYNVMKNLEAGGDISEQSQGKA
jgi:hypothetical protein